MNGQYSCKAFVVNEVMSSQENVKSSGIGTLSITKSLIPQGRFLYLKRQTLPIDALSPKRQLRLVRYPLNNRDTFLSA